MFPFNGEKLRHKEGLWSQSYPVKLWQNPDFSLALTEATLPLKQTLKGYPSEVALREVLFFKNFHLRVLKHSYKIKSIVTVLSVSELHSEEI